MEKHREIMIDSEEKYKLNSVTKTLDYTLSSLKKLWDIVNTKNFSNIIDAIVETEGKVLVTGMGKSWIIWKKIAATLASTWTSSLFIHPGEAFHGDLGMFEAKDIVLALSNSGNTEELINILPVLKNQIKTKVIWITSNSKSKLAEWSNYSLIYSIEEEWYNKLAPMASTSTQLVLWDLIASALMERKSFKDEDFALFHPWGALWKKLLLTMSNIIKKYDSLDNFIMNKKLTIRDSITKLTNEWQAKGWIVIVDDDKQMVGVFTDWDLKRVLNENNNANLDSLNISDYMTKEPKYAYLDDKPVDVLNLMETNDITFLPVLDRDENLVSVINIHDLLKEWIK